MITPRPVEYRTSKRLVRRLFPVGQIVQANPLSGPDRFTVTQGVRCITIDVRESPIRFALQYEIDGAEGWATDWSWQPDILIVRPSMVGRAVVFDAARLKLVVRDNLARWVATYPTYGCPFIVAGESLKARYVETPAHVVIAAVTAKYGTGPSVAGLPVAMWLD